MAYVSDYTIQFSTAGATSYVLTLPEHVAGDILVVGANADGGVTLAMTGWTQIGVTQTSAATMSSGMWWIRATSSTTTGTITMGTADAINVSMFVISDVDATTAIDITSPLSTSTSGVFATASQFTSASVTTTTADCLIIYYMGIEPASTTAISALTIPGPTHFLDSSDAGGSTSTTMTGSAAAWYYQRSIGATPTPTWDLSASSITHRFVVAFRHKSGGIIPPYIDDVTNLGSKISTGSWWVSATAKDGESFPAALTHTSIGPTGNNVLVTGASGDGTTVTITHAEKSCPIFPVGSSITVAGITPAGYNATATVTASTKTSVSYANATTTAYTSGGTIVQTQAATYDAAAVVLDAGFNPYSSALNSTPAVSTTNAGGFQINFNSIDMSSGWIAGGFMCSNAKMANFNQATIKQGGTYLVVSDSTNFRTFRIMARDNQDGNGTGFSVFSVMPNQTYSSYGGSSTAPTMTAINKIFIGSKGQNAAGVFYYTDIHFFKQVTVAGGTSTAPVDTQGLYNVGRYCRIPLIKKSGAYGLLAYVPIQIGGGDAVNFQIDAGALQFPRIFDVDALEINYHGDKNSIGISYAGKSGDVIKHTNSVITSPSPYYWQIHANATNAATWDFSGLVLVKATVTLRPVMTFNSMSFSGCTISATNASSISNSIFSGSGEVTAASSTITSCTFTKSIGVNGAVSITGASQVALQAELDKLVSNKFTDNITPLGALRIIYTGAASAITLNMTSGTFSGNTKDIRWEAPASSNLTLNLSGGANAATYSATNSNTVTFSNPKQFVITNIIDGTEVRIYKQSDLSELGGAENVGATPSGLNNVAVASDPDNAGRYKVTYSYNYTADIPVFVVALHNNYQALRPAFTIKSTDSSLQISQIGDRQYLNP